jgi:hypothetical protein
LIRVICKLIAAARRRFDDDLDYSVLLSTGFSFVGSASDFL